MKPAQQRPDPLAQVHQHLAYLNDQLLVTRQRLYALEAAEALRQKGQQPRFPIEFRSQYGEDLWIWDVLGRQTEGFFIEAGAFDGYHYSVTLALEAIGWKGLLVEALPELYEKCRARRPASRVVHTALTRRNAPGTIKFVNVHDHYGGMLSFAQGSTEHAKKIEQERYRTTNIEVPATTLNELLKDHDGPIDVAMIDVEGTEIDVLDGFSLDRFKPRLLLLEENTGGRDPRLAQYMATQPYVSAGWVGVNMVYVRADEQKMLERLNRY